MNISLIDVDGHGFPNLALMKLSAWHKQHGDAVEWYSPLFSQAEQIYASKVFTFTPDYQNFAAGAPNPVRGGTGYDATVKLPDEIERTLPDYSLYPDFTSAVGFLTRGCIRACPWCVVPRKVGKRSRRGAQPFRDFVSGGNPPVELRLLAHWCNIQSIRKTVKFDGYK